jgi:hypothetical protein
MRPYTDDSSLAPIKVSKTVKVAAAPHGSGQGHGK